MKYIVIKGGTWCVGSHYFESGTHPCEDEEVLAAARREELPWVKVVQVAPTGEQLTLRTEPAQPALPTPGQKLIAETKPGDDERGAAARIAEVVADPPKEEPPGEACPFCNKNLRNVGAQISHIKSAHPDQYEEWNEKRKEAKHATA